MSKQYVRNPLHTVTCISHSTIGFVISWLTEREKKELDENWLKLFIDIDNNLICIYISHSIHGYAQETGAFGKFWFSYAFFKIVRGDGILAGE